ncbi:MAG: hypothetical protein JOZ43_07925, partial [Acidobacteriales bacterium]|nr:hypothetical protein [Terriglobales bacterium]
MRIHGSILFVLGMGWGQELPPVPHGQVVALTQPGHFSEPSVAVNPANPEQVLAAY